MIFTLAKQFENLERDSALSLLSIAKTFRFLVVDVFIKILFYANPLHQMMC